MRGLYGSAGLDSLRADSIHYGLLMRKFQIEAMRREIPYGGYVVSVIRDIPNASMGLIDYLDQPKWSETDWSWQGDSMSSEASLSFNHADAREFLQDGPVDFLQGIEQTDLE